MNIAHEPTMSFLRAHDVAVALQLCLEPGLAYRPLADAVGLSQGETHNAVQRLVAARLVRGDTRAVNRGALLDFLTGGVPYAYATSIGAETRGVPTSHAAPPLKADFPNADAMVWPSADGKVRGAAVEPLYPAAPATARRNPALYELLALVDALRVGRARERQRARTFLRERLLAEEAVIG